jgi:hypothetical protein
MLLYAVRACSRSRHKPSGLIGGKTMRLVLAALCLSVFIPAVATAAIPRPESRSATVKADVQVADYYSGKKHCRKVGSATVCN